MTKKVPCCQKPQISNKEFNDIKDFLDIISEKNRLHILCMLKDGKKCVCDIYKPLNLSQNLVSHHLKILKEFEIVEAHRKGKKIIYSTNKEMINKYIDLLNNFLTKSI